ncbi:MAG: nucleotidyltransferase family protein [Pseudonocardiaceae bacterium]
MAVPIESKYRTSVARLDIGNQYVHAAVRAIAASAPPPAPPSSALWAERAVQHGVLSMIAVHMEPSSAENFVRAIRRRVAGEYLRTMADMRFVHRVFGEAGIEWLVFKGPVLSDVIYERPRSRDYSDLDVLVRPDEIERAVKVLTRNGAQNPPSEHPSRMRRLGRGELSLLLHNGTLLDLHWDVINKAELRSRFAISADHLFADSREVQLDGSTVRTFGEIDTILHLALHGCFSGADKLRYLLDLQQALKKSKPSAPSLLRRAESFGLELMLRLMVNRMTAFVDDAVPLRLPRSSVAANLWLAADHFAISHYPPGSRFEGRFSGGTISLSTRESPSASWYSLTKRAPIAARGRHA